MSKGELDAQITAEKRTLLWLLNFKLLKNPLTLKRSGFFYCYIILNTIIFYPIQIYA